MNYEKLRERYVGKIYNYLEVLDIIPGTKKGKRRSFSLSCKCICGKICKKYPGDLKKGYIKSCGCKRKELWKNKLSKNYKPTPLSLERRRINTYKRTKWDWLLTEKEAIKMFYSNCYYCDISPCNLLQNKNKRSFVYVNGIDRVDTTKHYTSENTVPCCESCNRMKMNHRLNCFIFHIESILRHIKPELFKNDYHIYQ